MNGFYDLDGFYDSPRADSGLTWLCFGVIMIFLLIGCEKLKLDRVLLKLVKGNRRTAKIIAYLILGPIGLVLTFLVVQYVGGTIYRYTGLDFF